MSIIRRTQSTTSFVTSLNRSVTYLSDLFRFDGHLFCYFAFTDSCQKMVCLSNNIDVLFDFLWKNNVLFDFCSVCICLFTDDCIFVAKS